MASLSANTVGYTKKATANAVQIIGVSNVIPLSTQIEADLASQRMA